jgi:amino-acid N-acetyltransferase
MNTQLIDRQVSATAARPRSRRVHSARPSTQVAYRQPTPAEAPAIYRLIATHLAEGRLLPRDIAELTVHAHRFVVAVRGGHIAGCAELAPLSGRVAEIRSLVVDRAARSLGIGRRLIEELHRRARVEGFEQLCAFAHDAAYFVRLGFSIVPHTWVPEKIARDCTSCAQFRRCGQHAVVRPVHGSRRGGGGSFVPLSALRG